MDPVKTSQVTDQLVTVLSNAGITTHDADNSWTEPPKAVVYQIEGRVDESFLGDGSHRWGRWQVSCVGSTRAQADWLAERVLGVVLGKTLGVYTISLDGADSKVTGRRLQADSGIIEPESESNPDRRWLNRAVVFDLFVSQ